MSNSRIAINEPALDASTSDHSWSISFARRPTRIDSSMKDFFRTLDHTLELSASVDCKDIPATGGTRSKKLLRPTWEADNEMRAFFQIERAINRFGSEN